MEADWTALKDGSACMSMGERCWENDFSFVWVMRRFPCFLVDGVIVILDVDGVIPVWHPDDDKSGDMLGAFEFYQNAFRERCGIYINDNGEICLDLEWNNHRIDCGLNDVSRSHKVFGVGRGDQRGCVEAKKDEVTRAPADPLHCHP